MTSQYEFKISQAGRKFRKKQTKSSNGVFSQSFNPNGNCTIICKALVYFQDEGAVRLWGKKENTFLQVTTSQFKLI